MARSSGGTAAATTRIYRPGDKDTPEELKELLRRVLSKHLENTTNPHYTELLKLLWHRCINLAPDEEVKVQLARLMYQEVEHGVITARILKHLGVDKVENPIEQYMFQLPIDTWCDLCYFHALGDRVGMYIGETWGEVPYEPLQKVTDKLHRDEVFHASLGLSNLKKLCATQKRHGPGQRPDPQVVAGRARRLRRLRLHLQREVRQVGHPPQRQRGPAPGLHQRHPPHAGSHRRRAPGRQGQPQVPVSRPPRNAATGRGEAAVFLKQ